MKRHPLPLTLTLTATSLLALTAAQGADFRWIGGVDASSLDNAGNWDVLPSGASSATADAVVIGSGDRVLMQQTGAGPANHLGTAADLVTVTAGGRLSLDGGGWGPSIANSQVNLDPGGIVEAIGGSGDTNRLTHLRLTGTNSTSYLTTDARLDIRDGNLNQVDFGDNNTLEQSTSNGQGLNFVYTSWLGSGTLKMTGGALSLEDGFAGSPTVTIDATNTNITSWAGHNDTIVSPIILRNAQIESRYEDFGKQYNGTITIPAGNTGTFNTELDGDPNMQGIGATPGNTNDQSIVVNAAIVGGGTMIKNGGGTLTLNASNSQGASNINAGTVHANATNALGTGPVALNGGTINANATSAFGNGPVSQNGGTINANATNALGGGSFSQLAGSTLNTNTFSQSISGGSIAGTVTGSGGLRTTGGTTTISSLNVSKLEMSGGIVQPTVNNALGNSTVVVSENSILKPTNQTLNFHYESNHLDGADNAAYGNGLRVNDPFNPNALMGAVNGTIPGQTNIAQIDGTSKPFGNWTRYTYTGQLNNTGGSSINLSFAEQYDDEARVIIDGVDVLNDTGWNTATSTSNRIGQAGINADGTFTLTPGAHDIVIQAFDGWGGAGPNTGWDKGIGWREGAYAITDPHPNDTGTATAGTLADSAAFMRIGTGTVPNAALKFSDGADKSFNQDFALSAGKTLTVDTSDMLGGNKVILTGALSGAGGLAKTGAGTMELTGVSTFSGQTMVAQGTLRLGSGVNLNSSSEIAVSEGATFDTSSAAPIYTIPAAQTLSGNGIVIGNITVLGHLDPGASIGQLDVVGDLKLRGVADFEVNRTGAVLTSDLVSVTGKLTYGGTLNVISTGQRLRNGDTFNLFDFGTESGNFSATNFPTWDDEDYWVNNLVLDGTVTYIPEASTTGLGLMAAALLMRRRRR